MADNSWYRCYGLGKYTYDVPSDRISHFFFLFAEDWTFNPDGLMRKRQMSGNIVKIEDHERFFKDGTMDEDYDTVDISEKHW